MTIVFRSCSIRELLSSKLNVLLRTEQWVRENNNNTIHLDFVFNGKRVCVHRIDCKTWRSKAKIPKKLQHSTHISFDFIDSNKICWHFWQINCWLLLCVAVSLLLSSSWSYFCCCFISLALSLVLSRSQSIAILFPSVFKPRIAIALVSNDCEQHIGTREKQSRRIYFMPSITLFGNDIRFSYWICALHFCFDNDFAYLVVVVGESQRSTANSVNMSTPKIPKGQNGRIAQPSKENKKKKNTGPKQFTNDTKYSLTK